MTLMCLVFLLPINYVAIYFFLLSLNFKFNEYPEIHFYRPQRSCGQGNIFTPVCHSFCSQGVLPQCMLGYHPPPTPRPGRHPPGTRQTPPPGADTHSPPGDQADPPWDQADPPGSRPPWTRQTPPGPGRPPPPDQADPPRSGRPPGKQTPAYCLRAAGTHPTGMHSCYINCSYGSICEHCLAC